MGRLPGTFHRAPRWRSKPLTHAAGVEKGQPPTGDPRATLLKPQGCRREGLGTEFPTLVRAHAVAMDGAETLYGLRALL